jgi:hypothetical protein
MMVQLAEMHVYRRPVRKIRASVKDEDIDLFGTALQVGGLLTPFFKIS